MSQPRLEVRKPPSKWLAVTTALASELEGTRAKLELSAKQLEAVYAALDNIESGVMLLDKDLCARYTNPALHLIFNLSLTPGQIIEGEVHYSELLRQTRPEYAVLSSEADEYIAKRLAWVISGDSKPTDVYLANGRVIRSQCAVL
ncbi:MAG TPA: PAS-domain containing protein, partial [Sphingomicrobium sp.]|nr:PAS-domain containing protein [Sphingomicrobium sp.]